MVEETPLQPPSLSWGAEESRGWRCRGEHTKGKGNQDEDRQQEETKGKMERNEEKRTRTRLRCVYVGWITVPPAVMLLQLTPT